MIGCRNAAKGSAALSDTLKYSATLVEADTEAMAPFRSNGRLGHEVGWRLSHSCTRMAYSSHK